jgi:hypothetical protein
LDQVAILLPQQGRLRFRLHPLGGHHELQLVAHRQNGGNDRPGTVIPGQVANERLIDRWRRRIT